MAQGPTRHDFTADPAAERTVIWTVVDDKGHFTLVDGQPLPKLRPGTRVEMRLSLAAITSKEERQEFRRRDRQELLPPGQRLFLLVDSRAMSEPQLAGRLRSEGLWDVLERGRHTAEQIRAFLASRDARAGKDVSKAFDRWACALEVAAHEPVAIERKGMNLGRLLPCACTVGGVRERDDGRPAAFGTLNHALAAMSERIELHRATKGGNAFLRYVWHDERGSGDWYRLDDLRARAAENVLRTDFSRGMEALQSLAATAKA